MIINTYQEAVDWLAGGRKKWERPLYTRGLRLRKTQANPKDIEVFYPWTNQAVVVFHPDDTITIQARLGRTRWGGYYNPLYSWSVREVIRMYSGITSLYQRNNKFHIVLADATRKPPKIQKCRRCHGAGLVDGYCTIPYCHSLGSEECDKTTLMPATISKLNGGWHRHKCVHGLSTNHYTTKTEKCFGCNGYGKKDYGSQLVTMLWDGTPLRLQHGTLVNNKPSELEKAIAAYVPNIS